MHSHSYTKKLVFGAILASLLLQMGFAVGALGPAWLNPLLSLPCLILITWLWRRSERENQQTKAFNQLVI